MSSEPTLPLTPPIEATTDHPDLVVETMPSPRIRWAGIVWGAVFAVITGVVLAAIADPTRRDAIRDWALAFDPLAVQPGYIVAVTVIAVGVVFLITGGVAALRRAQRRSER